MSREPVHNSAMTEADTCRNFVTPKIAQAGWSDAPFAIGEQRTFTSGRIFVAGGKVRRGKQRRADYILFYRRDFPLAVVEAKEAGLPAGARQGSCRLIYAASGCIGAAFEWAATTESRSGLRVTALMGVQSRVVPDQRAGLRSRACR